MTRLAVAVLAALAAACAHAPARPRPARVFAEGWAPLDARDRAGVRRAAIADALRGAVQQAAGAKISARTRVSRSVAIDDEVSARVRGAVRSYDVVEEKEESGFLKVRVAALVESEPPQGGRPEPPPGDPRVRVTITGANAASATAGVRRGLLERGFTVVDDGDADISVQGEVAAHPHGLASSWPSSRARVSLEARSKQGQILSTTSREASAVGLGTAAAQAKASEAAGLLSGEDLAREMASRLAE